MRKIRMRTREAGPDGNYEPGAVRRVDDALADALVGGGYAEDLGADDAPRVKAAPVAAPETATAEPEAETATMPPPRRRRKTHEEVQPLSEDVDG